MDGAHCSLWSFWRFAAFVALACASFNGGMGMAQYGKGAWMVLDGVRDGPCVYR